MVLGSLLMLFGIVNHNMMLVVIGAMLLTLSVRR